MDYRELLKKYIDYVGCEEGTTFIDDINPTWINRLFSSKEWAELRKIQQELINEL